MAKMERLELEQHRSEIIADVRGRDREISRHLRLEYPEADQGLADQLILQEVQVFPLGVRQRRYNMLYSNNNSIRVSLPPGGGKGPRHQRLPAASTKTLTSTFSKEINP